jgi:VIT1/CCC1 family predicted Fe2+/Mn2+ transporter
MKDVNFLDRFALARLAYRRKDVKMAETAHADGYLETTLRENGARGEHLADAVLGATDGIVTTFAVVAGAAGAYLSPGIVLVMGFANLAADGFSMAVGNYLGARSQQEYWDEERKREIWEIEYLPEAEREEIRRLYRGKGFEGEVLERIVTTITGDKQRWVDEMMRDELGIQEDRAAPFASGAVTFTAFVLAGLFPLLSYVWAFLGPSPALSAFPVSIALAAVALFLVGSARCFMTHRSWWQSGLEILAVGGLAAGCAYAVGCLLRGLID